MHELCVDLNREILWSDTVALSAVLIAWIENIVKHAKGRNEQLKTS